MKNQEYTPGPWRLTAIPAGNSLTVMVSSSAGYDLVDALGNDAPTNPADARLIAAAPELAEAIVNYLRNGNRIGNESVDAVLVAALAKAGIL